MSSTIAKRNFGGNPEASPKFYNILPPTIYYLRTSTVFILYCRSRKVL